MNGIKDKHKTAIEITQNNNVPIRMQVENTS
jgi:hypothetical protein